MIWIKLLKLQIQQTAIISMYFGSTTKSCADYLMRQSTALLELEDLIYHYPRHIYIPRRKKQLQAVDDYLQQSQRFYRQRMKIYHELDQSRLYQQRNLMVDKRDKKKIIDDIVVNNVKPKQRGRVYSSNDRYQKPYVKGEQYYKNKIKTINAGNCDKNYKSAYNSLFHSQVKDEGKELKKIAKYQQIKTEKNINRSNQNKETLVGKFYQENSQKYFKQKQTPTKKQAKEDIFQTKQTSITKQIDIETNSSVLKSQIYFLKQQLQEKNRIIVDLQCQLVKKTKVQQMLSNAPHIQIVQNKETPQSSRQQFSSSRSQSRVTKATKQTQVEFQNKCKRQLVLQKKSIDLKIPPTKILLKQVTMDKSNTLLQMSIQKFEGIQTKQEFMQTDASVFKNVSRQQFKPSKLQQSDLEFLPNTKNAVSKIQTEQNQINAEAPTSQNLQCISQEYKDSITYQLQNDSASGGMLNSPPQIADSISMRFDSEQSENVELTLSASYNPSDLKNRRKQSQKIKEKHTLVLQIQQDLQQNEKSEIVFKDTKAEENQDSSLTNCQTTQHESQVQQGQCNAEQPFPQSNFVKYLKQIKYQMKNDLQPDLENEIQ